MKSVSLCVVSSIASTRFVPPALVVQPSSLRSKLGRTFTSTIFPSDKGHESAQREEQKPLLLLGASFSDRPTGHVDCLTNGRRRCVVDSKIATATRSSDGALHVTGRAIRSIDAIVTRSRCACRGAS